MVDGQRGFEICSGLVCLSYVGSWPRMNNKPKRWLLEYEPTFANERGATDWDSAPRALNGPNEPNVRFDGTLFWERSVIRPRV